MKQHKIVMRPPGFGRLPERFIPEGAKLMGGMTEAGLIGTITPDGDFYYGLLKLDETIVIEDAQMQLINRPGVLIALREGKVHKRMASGLLEYDVKARLVMIAQQFEPSEEVKAIFDIEVWEPDVVMMKRVVKEVEVE